MMTAPVHAIVNYTNQYEVDIYVDSMVSSTRASRLGLGPVYVLQQESGNPQD